MQESLILSSTFLSRFRHSVSELPSLTSLLINSLSCVTLSTSVSLQK